MAASSKAFAPPSIYSQLIDSLSLPLLPLSNRQGDMTTGIALEIQGENAICNLCEIGR